MTYFELSARFNALPRSIRLARRNRTMVANFLHFRGIGNQRFAEDALLALEADADKAFFEGTP